MEVMLLDEHLTASQQHCCCLQARVSQTSLTSTRSCSATYTRCWDHLYPKAFWQSWGPLRQEARVLGRATAVDVLLAVSSSPMGSPLSQNTLF